MHRIEHGSLASLRMLRMFGENAMIATPKNATGGVGIVGYRVTYVSCMLN